MRRRYTSALFGLICPLLGLPRAISAEGILVAEPEIVEMGKMWYGVQAAHEVTLRNSGDAPVTLRAIRTPCSCTSASSAKTTLGPGESDVLKVGIDSRRAKGIWTKWVNIETDNPDRPYTRIMLKGETLPLIDIKPEDGLRLGRLTTEAQIDRTFELTCLYDKPLNLKLAPLEGQPLEAQLTPIEAGKKYTLTVRNPQPLPLGSVLTSIPLETGVDFCPVFKIETGGFVIDHVSVFPEDIYVPPRRLTPSPHILNIVFRKERPLQIEKIEADFPNVVVEPLKGPFDLPDGPDFKHYTVQVTVPGANEVPIGLGGKLKIHTNDPDYRTLEIPVSRIMSKARQQQMRQAREAARGDDDGPSLD